MSYDVLSDSSVLFVDDHTSHCLSDVDNSLLVSSDGHSETNESANFKSLTNDSLVYLTDSESERDTDISETLITETPTTQLREDLAGNQDKDIAGTSSADFSSPVSVRYSLIDTPVHHSTPTRYTQSKKKEK